MKKQTNLINSLYILIPGGFGDNLMATAVVEGIHRQYPDIRIFLLTKRMDIWLNNPHIVMCYNTRTILKQNPSLHKRAVVLGYRSYSQIRSSSKKQHLVDDMYDKLPLVIKDRQYHPRIYLTQPEKQYKWRQLQRLPRPLIAVAPYGGWTTKIQNKFYPLGKWKQLTALLIEAGVTIIQFGRKKEGPVLPGARSWTNIGYRRMAAVLLHCDAVITHVGGIMHLATAISVPCVTLYAGVEDPSVSGYEKNLNLFVPLECSPCWLEKPCADTKCKTLLTPEKVASETLNLIKKCI